MAPATRLGKSSRVPIDREALGLSRNKSFLFPIETFELEIRPEKRNWYEPGDEIRGKLIMHTYDYFYCLGVQVSLEGNATVSYQSGDTIKIGGENLVPFDWATQFFIGSRYNQKEIHVPLSNYEFSFCFPIEKLNPFAGTFNGTSGEIVYSISACINTTSTSQRKQTKKKIITVKSYLNLNSMPINNKPVYVKSQEHRFSKKARLTYTLNLFQRGFLSGESIHFRLTAFNKREIAISGLSVSLIRKISYFVEDSTTKNKSVLDKRENTDTSEFVEPVIVWADSLTVPDDTYPSNRGVFIRHEYFLRIQINTYGKDEPTLKGDVPINIGSVRENETR